MQEPDKIEKKEWKKNGATVLGVLQLENVLQPWQLLRQTKLEN